MGGDPLSIPRSSVHSTKGGSTLGEDDVNDSGPISKRTKLSNNTKTPSIDPATNQ